ncbi:MAG: hypothetical protein CMN33_02625 [Saprospirales bacterium]|nr:hypothetical protein [Saprospirales bacterium]|tara:strand:- start:2413 stop:2775 length:363 start_codon:yes stop_codon:yes gene_type:complete
MSSLPNKSKTSEGNTTEFFDKYFTKKLNFPSNEVDAIIGFFTKRGFDEAAAQSTGTILLEQAKIDNVNVFTLLDTLKGLNDIQLSTVVAEVLNYNRDATSSVGFKRPQTVDKIEKRNIVV